MIDFVQLPSGKWHPVEGLEPEVYFIDRQDTTSAPQLVIVTEDGDLIRGRQVDRMAERALRVEGRESHFPRCPKAGEFRQ